MNRNWIWGLGVAALVLAVALAMPRTARDGRMGQDPIPGSPTRTELDTNRPSTSDLNQPRGPQPMTMSARINSRVTDAARSVEGVDEAWAAVKGTTAVVGITVDPSLTARAEEGAKKAVAEQVKELPEIMQVGVTTDPNLTRQIRDIDRAIAADEPATQWDGKLQTLIDELVETTG
ncbi:MAG: YhcN/YlaJ family sporulation lipoprotein [Limnochordia bacterium]|jgi:hypothetical protein